MTEMKHNERDLHLADRLASDHASNYCKQFTPIELANMDFTIAKESFEDGYLKACEEKESEIMARLIGQEHQLGSRIDMLEKKNEALHSKLKSALEVIEYYASFDQWGHTSAGSNVYSVVDKDDLGSGEFFAGPTDDKNVGGRKAREYLRDEESNE